MNINLNFVQEDSLVADQFRITHSYKTEKWDEDQELNILYSRNMNHYEALIPCSWKLTGKLTPQSVSEDDIVSPNVSYEKKSPSSWKLTGKLPPQSVLLDESMTSKNKKRGRLIKTGIKNPSKSMMDFSS